VTGRFARGEKPRIAAHLPHLAEHALGGFQQRKIYIRADIEDADLERRVTLGIGKECDDLFFFARVERAGDDASACTFDVGHERRQLVTVAATGEDSEAGSGEAPGDRSADKVARADDGDGRVLLGHARAPGGREMLERLTIPQMVDHDASSGLSTPRPPRLSTWV
jgi:hypothetical protein